jgi:hypothetical protein
MKNNRHGCFITEHEGNIETVFYIRPDLWLKVTSFDKPISMEIEQKYIQMYNNDLYMVKHSSAEIITPMPKSILEGMISEGESIYDIDIEQFVDKCNKKENTNITVDLIKNIIELLRHEVGKTEKILQTLDLKEQCDVEQILSDDSSDTDTWSDTTDSDSC